VTYSAKVAGLYPKDPVKAALADQVVAFMEDIIQVRTLAAVMGMTLRH
jgi:hypothetical protein